MFKRGDWVTIPSGYSAESAQMLESDRVVGIVFDFKNFPGETEDTIYPAAIVHVVDDQAGLTINEVAVPLNDVRFIEKRESVPPQRLATYEPHWVPRGVREGLV